MSGKKKEGLAVPPLILLVVDLTQGDKEQAWFVLFICRSPRVLQHSPVMTIWFCFQIKGDKQVCLTAWPKAPGSAAELPAPSNTSLCMCVPYTLAPGLWHRPRRALEREKTSFRSVRALAKQGLEANSVETLAAQYSQWFGRSRGEEVKPGEGTEKIPREERGGGQSECCTTQLRRGSCTWKTHHQCFL